MRSTRAAEAVAELLSLAVMSAFPPSSSPSSSIRDCLRSFWPWLVPFWLLPVPLFLLCLRAGFPVFGAASVPVLGFVAAVPLLRGRMSLPIALVLCCAVTGIAWLIVYLCVLSFFRQDR